MCIYGTDFFRKVGGVEKHQRMSGVNRHGAKKKVLKVGKQQFPFPNRNMMSPIDDMYTFKTKKIPLKLHISTQNSKLVFFKNKLAVLGS